MFAKGTQAKTCAGQMHDAGDSVFLREFKNGRQVAHVQMLDEDPLSDLILDEVGFPDGAASRNKHARFALI